MEYSENSEKDKITLHFSFNIQVFNYQLVLNSIFLIITELIK